MLRLWSPERPLHRIIWEALIRSASSRDRAKLRDPETGKVGQGQDPKGRRGKPGRKDQVCRTNGHKEVTDINLTLV